MNEKQTAITAAKEAGNILMDFYGKKIKIIEKSPNNFVTEADLASEKVILDSIKKKFPDHQIISEEAGTINKSDHVWYIDPLDGTHNFIHKIPLFGVSIAYAYKDEVQLGVIYCPYVDELYVAEKGKGAFCNGKKVAVSDNTNLKRSMIIFEGGLQADTELKLKMLKKVVNSTFKIRIFGAAIYNLLSVAIGGADAYIELSTHPWDVAAGSLLIQEAGGKITRLDGKRWTIRDSNFVASNGKVHNQVLDIVH